MGGGVVAHTTPHPNSAVRVSESWTVATHLSHLINFSLTPLVVQVEQITHPPYPIFFTHLLYVGCHHVSVHSPHAHVSLSPSPTPTTHPVASLFSSHPPPPNTPLITMNTPPSSPSPFHNHLFPSLSLSSFSPMSSPPPSTTSSPSTNLPPPPPLPPSSTFTITTASTTPPTSTPPPRKFPAPCWTQEETLALIHAYQDKWYSLRRRNLRTSDWESVAADVSRRCPDQLPPKTSAQCRHKMEKLRKRYRTEKQRALSLPHNLQSRFFSPSSWVFFDLMDAMEAGSTPPQDPSAFLHNTNNGSVLRVVNDVNGRLDLPDRKPNIINNHNKDEFGKYFDEILMGHSTPTSTTTGGGAGGGGAGVPIKLKVKNNHGFNNHHVGHPQSNHHRYHHDEDDDDDYYDGSRNNMVRGPSPAGSTKRKFSGQDYDERFDLLSSKKSLNPNQNPSSKSGLGWRARDSVSEMVTSIKMLGEGLVRMEKMKMDMMREIEKMRMEMEMKRSKMILESQQLIVNAFVEGFKNKKKIKVLEVE